MEEKLIQSSSITLYFNSVKTSYKVTHLNKVSYFIKSKMASGFICPKQAKISTKATHRHALCHTSNLKVHCRSYSLGTIILIIWNLEFTKGIIFYPKGILACLKTKKRHGYSLKTNQVSKTV